MPSPSFLSPSQLSDRLHLYRHAALISLSGLVWLLPNAQSSPRQSKEELAVFAGLEAKGDEEAEDWRGGRASSGTGLTGFVWAYSGPSTWVVEARRTGGERRGNRPTGDRRGREDCSVNTRAQLIAFTVILTCRYGYGRDSEYT